MRIGFDQATDTTNQLFRIVNNIKGISVVKKSPEELKEDLQKGNLTALLSIQKRSDSVSAGNTNAPYILNLKT